MTQPADYERIRSINNILDSTWSLAFLARTLRANTADLTASTVNKTTSLKNLIQDVGEKYNSSQRKLKIVAPCTLNMVCAKFQLSIGKFNSKQISKIRQKLRGVFYQI